MMNDERDRTEGSPLSLRNVTAPSDLESGDYVFASRWGDCDWNDPWAVGFVSVIGKNFVEVAQEDGSLIHNVGTRAWPYAMRITKKQGETIIQRYTEAEGSTFESEVAANEVFGMRKTEKEGTDIQGSPPQEGRHVP